jgi:HK97 family phage major capsid protein|tara:strand:+ start:755 stop:1972 length:1218 start_codon:yes stop_codon:yes gene_type:complete
MKNSIELKEMRSDIIETLEGIKELATKEERDLTQDENNEVDGLLTEVDNLDSKIERAEKMETIKRNAAVVSGVTSTKVEKEVRDYSFQEALSQAANGRITGLVKEMDEEARSESRYTGQSFKGIGIPSSILTRAAVGTSAGNATEVMAWTDQLEANLVLASAGANFYSGVNNMKFPVFSSINSGFVAETGGSAPAANGTATSLTLSPKKCISIVNVSAEAVTQNASIEAALRRNMAQSVAATMESAFLANDDVTSAPTSLFKDATSSATSAISVANVEKMETDVLAADVALEGARMAYILNPAAYADVKSLAQVASVSALYDNADKRLNGYFSFITSNLNSGGTASKTAAMFGDFSKVHVAQFGGLDVIYDIYSGAGTGEPRYVLTSLVDAGAVQATTFHKNLEA